MQGKQVSLSLDGGPVKVIKTRSHLNLADIWRLNFIFNVIWTIDVSLIQIVKSVC